MTQPSDFLIRSLNPESEFLLNDLSAELDERGLQPQRIEQPAVNADGKKQSATLLLAILATPSAIKFAGKLGDAIIAWVKSKEPKTIIEVSHKGKTLRLDTNQISKSSPTQVTEQITAFLDVASIDADEFE